MPAEFDLRRVEQGIQGTRFRGRLMHFASVGSTNQLALYAAAAGAREGVWIAEEQTAGRGRGGHTWHSNAGDGLYVSALVAPPMPLSRAPTLALATGLAARAAVLEAAGLTADIRWPNDLMFGERKFGGILVESSSGAGDATGTEARLRYAVIGIGINVGHPSFPEELRRIATSLRLEGGCVVAREPLLASLLRHLDAELSRLDASPDDPENGSNLIRRFAAASTWAEGKRVRVEEAGGYTGWTRGLDPQGFLRVEDDARAIRTVLSGGVRSA